MKLFELHSQYPIYGYEEPMIENNKRREIKGQFIVEIAICLFWKLEISSRYDFYLNVREFKGLCNIRLLKDIKVIKSEFDEGSNP